MNIAVSPVLAALLAALLILAALLQGIVALKEIIKDSGRSRGWLVSAAICIVLATFAGYASYTSPSKLGTPSSSSSNTITPNTTPSPTSTPSPTTPYPPIGWKIALSDPLNKPSYWQNGSDANTGSSCQFSNGAYHIQAKNINYFCTGPGPVFKDVVFEVSMTIIKGNCGGIWFRGNYAAATPAYFFQVCQDQSYGLFLFSASSRPPLVPKTSSSAIHAGLNQSNLIAVVTIGNHFDLYVNQQKINSVNDGTLSSGQINIAAVAGNDLAEVVYQDAKVWTLSGS